MSWDQVLLIIFVQWACAFLVVRSWRRERALSQKKSLMEDEMHKAKMNEIKKIRNEKRS
jgi:hypothetical protein